MKSDRPLGFWDIRGKNLADRSKCAPIPISIPSAKQVASLFLRTNRAGIARPCGNSARAANSRSCASTSPGDGFDTIHWKATARRGHPITKVYQVEKTQEVYVIIDASRLSARLQVPGDPSQGTHLDRYIAATLVLGLAAEKQGDLFGLLTFGDRVFNFVRARNGKEHYSACREALYRLEPQSVSPDFEEVATFIRLRLRRRALLVFMTDLDDPIIMESFQRSADLICRKHLVLVQMLQTADVQPVFYQSRRRPRWTIFTRTSRITSRGTICGSFRSRSSNTASRFPSFPTRNSARRRLPIISA